MACNYNSFMGLQGWILSQLYDDRDIVVTEDIDFEVVEPKLLTYNIDVPSTIFERNKELQDKINKLR